MCVVIVVIIHPEGEVQRAVRCVHLSAVRGCRFQRQQQTQMSLKSLRVKSEGKGPGESSRRSDIRGTGGACQGDPEGMAKTRECTDVIYLGASRCCHTFLAEWRWPWLECMYPGDIGDFSKPSSGLLWPGTCFLSLLRELTIFAKPEIQPPIKTRLLWEQGPSLHTHHFSKFDLGTLSVSFSSTGPACLHTHLLPLPTCTIGS